MRENKGASVTIGKKEEFKPCNTDQSELFVLSCRRRGERHESVCVEKPLLNQ